MKAAGKPRGRPSGGQVGLRRGGGSPSRAMTLTTYCVPLSLTAFLLILSSAVEGMLLAFPRNA